MMQHRNLAALAIALMMAACGETSPLGPDAVAVDAELSALITSASAETHGSETRGGAGSNLFDRLAAEIPGFGGLYRNGPCAVAVVLTDMSQADHAKRVVDRAIAPLVRRSCPDGIRVHPVEGQFTYIELQRWLAASRPLLEIRGVNGVAVNYQLNRLVISVAAHAVVPVVLEALERLGIPERAVVFEGGGGRG
jgi:hypothetical protein